MRRSSEFNWASVLAGKDALFRGLMRRPPVFDVVRAVLGDDCILSAKLTRSRPNKLR